MPQHFSLSCKSRKFSPIKMAQLSDGEARALLCQIRWGGVRKMWSVRNAAFNILLIALPVAINGGVNIAIIPLALHQAQFLPTVNCLFRPIFMPLPYSLMLLKDYLLANSRMI